MKILVTGGTIFASRYVAEYYVHKHDMVFCLNRGNNPPSENTTLIKADRNNLGDSLKDMHFDTVLDITAYTDEHINSLLDSGITFDSYVMISSSAVYPETLPRPFKETYPVGENKIWGAYGTNKIAAENALLQRVPNAYIIRPPYLYGDMNNLYRESFVFDCAMQERKFYIPQNNIKLQFFYIGDLCRFIDKILEIQPKQHIFNGGNKDCITIAEWVKLCYQAVGKTAELAYVTNGDEQRNYFCFYDYEYSLDVEKQYQIMSDTTNLLDGLKSSFAWYKNNPSLVRKKDYIHYIDQNF